jgi:hypothetical protein
VVLIDLDLRILDDQAEYVFGGLRPHAAQNSYRFFHGIFLEFSIY